MSLERESGPVGNAVSDPIFEVRDITVSFGMERGESRVLDSVSIDIQRQEVLGIVGESGSGKSMFASALLDAIVNPGQLSGSITYHPSADEAVDLLNVSTEELKQLRWEEISMVFQGAMSSFNPTMQIRGHFEETLKAHDYDVDGGLERAHELLSDLYLEPERILDSYPHELSGGMRQRALIALSLVLEPRVLVMDEPTAALDLLMQQSIINLLSELKEKHDLTLVFITHDLPLVAELCDRVAVLYAFDFVEVGPTEDLIDGAGHPYTRALLNATPNLNAPPDEMRPIEGSAPDPVAVPDGCSYHPRCDLATEECIEQSLPYYDMGDGHAVACHHREQAVDEIPLSHLETNDASKAVTESTLKTTAQTSSGDANVDNESEPVISVDDVSIHFEEETGVFDLFKDPQTVHAVDGVSFDIEENDVIALVGESGCGKTTLGKSVIGLQRPTEGNIRYRGQDIWDAKDRKGEIEIPFKQIRRSLQIIHQDPGSSLNPNKKVISSLSLPLKKYRPDLSREERQNHIYGMLETVGMSPPDDYAGRYPHQLSGGETQRVALVRALLMNPHVILADEAISALDVSLRVDMMDLFLDLQDTFNTSYVFISHDLSNARYLAEMAGGRIAVMYLGQIVEIGPPEQIIHNPQHPYTKALRWATPDLNSDGDSDLPLRSVDIPDPVNPPSGCRFHTRCPEARETCKTDSPELIGEGNGEAHQAACYRVDESHEYWDGEPISEAEDAPEMNS
ncbi:ABC transporter ATP-binding protein [Halocatena marina]|nr:ABC transporter ATP-binding protein [Halocatena marina]